MEKGLLEADEFTKVQDAFGEFTKINDVAVWRLIKLHERLLTKHHETFWIDVETKMSDGREYFRCTEIEHTKNPLPSQFDVLLDQGEITLDFLLCRPSGNGDTYSFKIKKKARPLLFPESDIYHIQPSWPNALFQINNPLTTEFNKIITLDEYDDLGTYDGDPAHDMNVDYDYQINTGKPVFDEPDSDDFADWDWYTLRLKTPNPKERFNDK